MRRAVAAAILSLLLGCATKHPVRTVIPRRCMNHLTITNFTKPCHSISDTLAICDGVEIRYSCIEYRRPQ